MSTALRNIVKIGILGLAAGSALADRGYGPSAVKNKIAPRNSKGNCAALTAELCNKFDLVRTRCPELCNDALKPQSTSSMLKMKSTTKESSTSSPTSSSSPTTPSPTPLQKRIAGVDNFISLLNSTTLRLTSAFSTPAPTSTLHHIIMN